LMLSLSHACIALPGGYGTLDELFETISDVQLGVRHLPIGLLDVWGYWRCLRHFLSHAPADGLVRAVAAGGVCTHVATQPRRPITPLVQEADALERRRWRGAERATTDQTSERRERAAGSASAPNGVPSTSGPHPDGW